MVLKHEKGLIRLLQHDEIDKVAWDNCVYSSNQSIIYALSWYLDIVSPRWWAVVLTLDKEYKAVLPLPVTQKFTFKYIRQPLFCQQLGIFSKEQISRNQAIEMIELVKANFNFVSLYNFNSANIKLLNRVQYEISYTHHLDLSRPYIEIKSRYSKQRINSLRSANNKNFRITQGENIEPLLELFKNNVAHKIYGGVQSKAYDIIRRLYLDLKSNRTAELIYTFGADGSINAGALFLLYKNQIIYLFNAANVTGRKNNSISLILDNIIQRNAETSKVLDFESPMIESIAGFYKSFGSEAVPYFEWHYNFLPWPIRLLKQGRQKLLTTLLYQNKKDK